MQNKSQLQRGTALAAFLIPQLGCLLIALLVLGLGVSQPVSVPPPTLPTLTPLSASAPLVLGEVVAAENIDRDGCAVDVTDRFDNDDAFYIVLQDSAIPEGTSVFVRLYQDGIAVEDTDELIAQQDYSNVCVNFVFENDDEWDSGEYEAEFFINGTAYQSVSFAVP